MRAIDTGAPQGLQATPLRPWRHAFAMIFAIFATLLMGVVLLDLLSNGFTMRVDVLENPVSHDETSRALPASVASINASALPSMTYYPTIDIELPNVGVSAPWAFNCLATSTFLLTALKRTSTSGTTSTHPAPTHRSPMRMPLPHDVGSPNKSAPGNHSDHYE